MEWLTKLDNLLLQISKPRKILLIKKQVSNLTQVKTKALPSNRSSISSSQRAITSRFHRRKNLKKSKKAIFHVYSEVRFQILICFDLFTYLLLWLPNIDSKPSKKVNKIYQNSWRNSKRRMVNVDFSVYLRRLKTRCLFLRWRISMIFVKMAIQLLTQKINTHFKILKLHKNLYILEETIFQIAKNQLINNLEYHLKVTKYYTIIVYNNLISLLKNLNILNSH